MDEKQTRTEKHELARRSLPEDLVLVFDDLVADYRFYAMKHHGSRFVSYAVLAEMVKAGWRLAEPPLPEKGTEDGKGCGHK